MRRLAAGSRHRHHEAVEDSEATQLMLETLFVIKGDVREIHAAIFGEDDEEEAEADS
jgi:hypothetical protein